jgi:predicted RNA-binding Zn ribbon-like protein
VRDAIARAATAVAGGAEPEPADVDAINLYAAIPDIPPVLEGGTRQAGRSAARTAQALSVVARDAVRLLSPGEHGRDRIRTCDADDCGIVFADDSRSRSRRWCSMARCGNRAKVRAYRSRARAAS